MKLLKVLYIILAILLIAMFIKTRREYFADTGPSLESLQAQYNIDNAKLLKLKNGGPSAAPPGSNEAEFMMAIFNSPTATNEFTNFSAASQNSNAAKIERMNPRELSTAFTFKNQYNFAPQYPKTSDTTDKDSIYVAIKNAIYKNY